MRSKRFLYNNVSSIMGQIITIVCGIILPKIMIAGFGSELYGATTSIAEFLGYIALIEGGIGGVARAALYKPLAEQNIVEVNKIIASIRQFFQTIAVFFVGYTLVIACTYKYIAKDCTFDWGFVFCLVIIISFSSFAEYYFGITYAVLLQADQRRYVIRTLQSATMIGNTVLSCILIYAGCNILVVKFAYCALHVVRIFILNLYVKRHYKIERMPAQKGYLQEKWDGLGQHIAYFLHSKTDIAVLTVFTNLREVAVYSVYNYVVSSLATLTISFISGMEEVFGNMFAKGEKEGLNSFFNMAEFMIHTIVIVFFSAAAVLIMPFISLYTRGITDADYFRPEVAYLFLIAEAFFCIRQPYGQLLIAVGEFKETRNAAFIEAALNIGLSCLFVNYFGMVGVVSATVIAMVYRTLYFIFYLSKNILFRPVKLFIKRLGVTVLNVGTIFAVVHFLPLQLQNVSSYMEWVFFAVVIVCLCSIITLLFSILFFRKESKQMLAYVEESFCKMKKKLIHR